MATADAIQPVVKRIEAIHRYTGVATYRAFRDWVDLMVYAFRRDDDAYLDTLGRYDDLSGDTEWVAQQYAEALAELTVATEEEQREVLGDVYEELGAQADDFGQYFTPWHLSIAKARMLFAMDDVDAELQDPPLTVSDPACGSGRLLIAAAMAVHDQSERPDAKHRVWVAGKDKDAVCAKMAAVNLVLAGVRGRVVHGDTLAMDTHAVWASRPSQHPRLVRLDATPEADPFAGRVDDEQEDAARDLEPTTEQTGLEVW